MRQRALVLMIGLSAALVGCSGPQGPQFTRADNEALTQMMQDFAAAYNGKNTDSLIGFFAGSGSLLPPNSSVIRGTDSIRSYFDIRFGEGATDLSLDVTGVEGEGNLAFTTGNYSLRNAPPGGEERRDRGKFLWIARKLGGQWRFEYQMWSSDLPPPAPPAPASEEPPQS